MYNQIEYTHERGWRWQSKQKELLKEAAKGKYSGRLTDGAKKRMAKAIDILCQIVKPVYMKNEVTGRRILHRLSFITLTVSQAEILTAKECYQKAFRFFLDWMRKKEGVNTYVWKVEKQQRGQIHYHITTPTFIHYQKIRDVWNNLQRKNGWLNSYYDKQGHWDANSTDIKAVKSVKNLSNYLKKEYLKAIQNPNTDGKVWDCSLNLKKFKYFTLPEQNHHLGGILDIVDNNRGEFISTDNCFIIDCRKSSPTEVMNLQEMQKYLEFLNDVRKYKR